MRSGRPIFLAVLAVSLATYAFDCGAAATPEHAMQCCKAMRCSSHGHHGQDCCKTMPAMRAVFGQPSSVQGASFSPVAFGVVPALTESHGMDPCARMIAAHCHAPPIFCLPALLQALRI